MQACDFFGISSHTSISSPYLPFSQALRSDEVDSASLGHWHGCQQNPLTKTVRGAKPNSPPSQIRFSQMWARGATKWSLMLHRALNHNINGGRSRSFSVAVAAAPAEENAENSEIVDFEYPQPDPKFAEVLRALTRTDETAMKPHKLRREGRIPSIIFSAENGETGGNKRLVSLEKRQIKSLIQRCGENFFQSRTFEVLVKSDNRRHILEHCRVLPRLVHINRVTDEILNVTLIRAPPGVVLKVNVPVLLRGEDACIGTRKGGYLNVIMRTIKFKCPADIIPPYIEVDVSELDIGKKLLISDLKFHPELKLAKGKLDWPVCNVIGSKFRAQQSASSK